jgi:hypothetical protein
MLITRTLISRTLGSCALIVTCGLAVTAPAGAGEQAAAFEYAPVARLTHGGQFRAEVWRRDVRTDRSDLAWSDSEPYTTAALAMVEACASLQKSFDPAFPCSRAHEATQARSGTARAAGPAPAPAAPKVATVSVRQGMTPAKAPLPRAGNQSASQAPNRQVVAGDKNTWIKEFWRHQDTGQGGGDGGGGGAE